MAKYLTLEGLSKFWGGVKTKLNGKVDVVEGKGLSTNDLTDELKAQYDEAERNVIAAITVNGEAVAPSDDTRTVEITIPETDLSGYYDKNAIDGKVTTLNEAIAAAASGKITITIVDSIDTENAQVTVDGETTAAVENVLYFIPRSEADDDNVYEEYMLISGALELVGTTEVDLSGYVQKTDIEVVSDDEIDTILAS